MWIFVQHAMFVSSKFGTWMHLAPIWMKIFYSEVTGWTQSNSNSVHNIKSMKCTRVRFCYWNMYWSLNYHLALFHKKLTSVDKHFTFILTYPLFKMQIWFGWSAANSCSECIPWLNYLISFCNHSFSHLTNICKIQKSGYLFDVTH